MAFCSALYVVRINCCVNKHDFVLFEFRVDHQDNLFGNMSCKIVIVGLVYLVEILVGLVYLVEILLEVLDRIS